MNINTKNSTNTSLDLKEILNTYTKHWKWFLLSLVLAVIASQLYLRYTIPQYAAQAKIQILDENSSSPELGVFKDLNILSGSQRKVKDEIEIIKSRSNFIEVVNDLGLNIKIEVIGNILNSEIYGKPKPFNIIFKENDSIIRNSKFQFYIEFSTKTTFGYYKKEGDASKVYTFGSTIKTPLGDIIVTPNIVNFDDFKDKVFRVDIKPVGDVAESYRKKVNVSDAGEFSNIINLSIQDPIQQKARDILNSVINTYNRHAVEDKKALADKTSNFIDDRITDIYSNLSTVDENAENLKTNRGLVDMASQSDINLSVGAANEQELQSASIQLQMASSMKDIVVDQKGYDILPQNIGINDPNIANTTLKYNELVNERNRLLKSSSDKNPVIVGIDEQLSSLKSNMKSSLSNMENSLSMKVNSLSGQLSKINYRLSSVPKNERALRDITRKQQTTEQLYLYLLQKREEAQITYASAAPQSNVVDYAFDSSKFPVSPNSTVILLAFSIIGLLIPFSLIYTADLLDNKINNKIGLEKIVKNVPVLAEIPRISKKNAKLIENNDRSILAESLRILRTNLDYIIKSKRDDDRGNIIYITSSVSGEGKTFLSSNLSMILAYTGKKVLLIGADIRNPKLYTFFNSIEINKEDLKTDKNTSLDGLTEYLYDYKNKVKDVINRIAINSNSIDIIYSGKIPPNPSELLMNDRMKILLNEVSDLYDYVIVDTAPMLVVTDTVLISEYADHIIYVTRAGMTEKKVIDYPLKLQEEGKLKNLSFVVNGVKETELGYGGKYGYGYGNVVKKWWKFWAN
tara:strand:- start:384 stop:2780 length:2397 start_codon:yes stop_codon:yes gene_type:complete